MYGPGTAVLCAWSLAPWAQARHVERGAASLLRCGASCEWCPELESNQHGFYPTRSLV